MIVHFEILVGQQLGQQHLEVLLLNTQTAKQLVFSSYWPFDFDRFLVPGYRFDLIYFVWIIYLLVYLFVHRNVNTTLVLNKDNHQCIVRYHEYWVVFWDDTLHKMSWWINYLFWEILMKHLSLWVLQYYVYSLLRMHFFIAVQITQVALPIWLDNLGNLGSSKDIKPK